MSEPELVHLVMRAPQNGMDLNPIVCVVADIAIRITYKFVTRVQARTTSLGPTTLLRPLSGIHAAGA